MIFIIILLIIVFFTLLVMLIGKLNKQNKNHSSGEEFDFSSIASKIDLKSLISMGAILGIMFFLIPSMFPNVISWYKKQAYFLPSLILLILGIYFGFLYKYKIEVEEKKESDSAHH